jgi:LacI family transcriptional regulator
MKFIIKIEDVDNCEIIISKLLEDKAIDAFFAVNELFAVTCIKLLPSWTYCT